MKVGDVLLFVFGIALLFSIVMLSLQYSRLTGHAVSTTVSNVSIVGYAAISMSTNLTHGVQFGTISTLPVTDANASHNYDGVLSMSSMFMNVSTDSNAAVDFCVKANSDLRDAGGDTLSINNETYSNSTITNLTYPLVASQVPLTTSYVDAGEATAVGATIYYRFWLDVPVAQPIGTYNNTVSIEGVTTGAAC